MSKLQCGLCGKDPATGFATIGDVRYCHGDDDPEPTCYMQSQHLLLPIKPLVVSKGEVTRGWSVTLIDEEDSE